MKRAKRGRILYPTGNIFRFGARLSHLVGSTARGSTGNGLRDAETVLIFYPTYERCVFRMVFLLFVFSILVYLASELAALGRNAYFNKRFRSVALEKHCAQASERSAKSEAS